MSKTLRKLVGSDVYENSINNDFRDHLSVSDKIKVVAISLSLLAVLATVMSAISPK